MKTNRSLTLMKSFGLAILAVVLCSGLASAQAFSGKFTLPFEARWGTAVLPAGDYTFQFNSGGDSPRDCVIVTGNGRSSFILSWSRGDSSTGESALTVVRHGNKGTVRALRLRELGLVLYYTAPKSERQVFAQAPELIQRLPISVAGK